MTHRESKGLSIAIGRPAILRGASPSAIHDLLLHGEVPMRTVLAALVVLGLSGGAAAKEAANVAAMPLDFTWAGTKACSSVSPAFTVSNVPAGTKWLSFKMVDLNVPSFQHGGGTVAFAGEGKVPQGAFAYRGPCPPAGSHDYEWTVLALDEKRETVLGRGKAVKAFPPK
jgi:phosphatidylethanolamine-binding protein (PEBP) family uncharacterized protein